jgi:hypothetical protein
LLELDLLGRVQEEFIGVVLDVLYLAQVLAGFSPDTVRAFFSL